MDRRTPSLAQAAAIALASLVCPAALASVIQDDKPLAEALLVPAELEARSNEEDDEAGGHDPHWLVVPIPFSNPTLDSGLVLGAGYFHAQTAQQAAVQPPSITGVGALYSGSGSYAVGIGNVSYWGGDTWRHTGVVAFGDIDFPLLAAADTLDLVELDWLLSGSLIQSEVSRRIAGHWYLGITGRYVDIEQEFDVSLGPLDFDIGSDLTSIGLGLNLTRDTRDLPGNAYEGNYFRLTSMRATNALGGDSRYQAHSASFRSYHGVRANLVLAWRVAGCARSGDIPLWDTCKIGLRGFPSTRYMGRSSYLAEIEGRWKLSKRWGVTTFGGAGRITESLAGRRDGDVIPSYGVGLRFTIQPENRVNMRLDYGRSRDDSAVYLSVGEAF